MAKGKPDNVVAIGAALDAPLDAPELAPAAQDPHGEGDEDDGFKRPRLPKSAPVRALGMKGQTCFYLDVKGQLIALGPRDHGKNNVLTLFSPLTHLPAKYWPQYSAPKLDRKTGEVITPSRIVGFDQGDASEALIGACGEAGIFDASGKVRSRGAHVGRSGGLVVHCGDKIMVAGRRVDGSTAPGAWHDPGLIDGYVYPAAAPAPRPVPDPIGEQAGERLLALLQTWRWKRAELDPMLALGWAGQAFICGALDWRTHVFVTGGAGTGKSTLNGKNGVFDRLLGAGALRTGNATEAAVRQTLGAQTIPVIFDEFEASEFNPMRTKAIVELARVASSGAEFHKGGQDHNAHEFVLQSAFQFSAILMPELQPQDRSRFAILELRPFERGPRPDPEDDSKPVAFDLDAMGLSVLGRELQRRMIDGFPRLARTLALYKSGLEKAGHSSRGQDTFGTLLACADLLLFDHAPDEREDELDQIDDVAFWASKCAVDQLAEIAHSVEEHDACVTHLATSMVQARGGDERVTVAAWIVRALADANAEMPDFKVASQLEHMGLKLVELRPTDKGVLGAVAYRGCGDGYLAIAGGHLGLSALFRESRWARGGYMQALGRVEGSIDSVKIRFDGRGLRAMCVPIGQVVQADEAGPAA